ncbi:uncharacterized protein GGS22DRAFT_153302 [Annulohypoxylon maeteangense]|uniref:uncharacterized protein n=1 Tax=Annulohypoxylon maeteangense TaxID=1927788 RepID=UPI002007DE51|nr:uncharacterized protein GGS22DRAFT_153302 [Annulohypoxylon maeteangense]KAI0889158.1 hypothetical protein GGS22DRAFT_153302 [Annulohypoxylon maeteangense]
MSPQIDIPNLTSMAPTGPTSPQHDKDAARAMSRTNSWTPSLGRRQSYHQEDQKHALQMSGVQDIQECPGFTERK